MAEPISTKQRVNRYIAEGESHCLSKHARIKENQQYERGNQWSKGDMERQALKERPAIPNNSLIKVINVIANREIVERFESRTYARGIEDGGIANALDAMGKWQRDQAETEHEESMGFRSAVASGVGVLHKYFQPDSDIFPGIIRDEELPAWAMLWPARARKTNLVDRRWHVCGLNMTREEAAYRFRKFGDKAKAVFDALEDDFTKYGFGPQSAKFVGSQHNVSTGWGQLSQGVGWYNVAQDEVFVVEAEWLEPQDTWTVAYPIRIEEVYSFIQDGDPAAQLEVVPASEENPEPVIMTKDQYAQLGPQEQRAILNQLLIEDEIRLFDNKDELNELKAMYLAIFGEQMPDSYWSEGFREVVKFAIMVNNEVIEEGIRPYGFTFEFITGWRVEGDGGVDFYGVIDVAKGPQDFKNAILSNMLSMYMTSLKSGMIIEEDAIVNRDEFLNDLAKPSGIGWAPAGFVASKDVKWTLMERPNFPPMSPELLTIAYTGVEELFGLSSIDLGTQGDLRRVSGTVVQAAKTSGNTIVATFFDSLRRFRRRFGLLNLKFILENYQPDDMFRILGPEKAEDLQSLLESGDPIDALKYDVKVDENPVSKTEQMEQLSYLQQVGSIDSWLQAGYITFPQALELMPTIQESFKRKVNETFNAESEKDKQIQEISGQLKLLQSQTQLMMQAVQKMPDGAAAIQEFEVQFGAATQMAEVIVQNNESQEVPQEEA